MTKATATFWELLPSLSEPGRFKIGVDSSHTTSFIFFGDFRNWHDDRGDSSENIGVPRIADVLGLPTRVWSRKERQLIAVHFTPAANISIPKLSEIHRSVEFIFPAVLLDFSLTSVDTDK